MSLEIAEEQNEHLCNLCGLSCSIPLSVSGFGLEHCGLVNAEVVGGYGSTPGNGNGALDDCTAYQFSLCEWCLDWLFSQFKIPVVQTDSMEPLGRTPAGDMGPWKPAEQRVKEDDWRTQKEEFFKEFERRNKARSTK